MSPAAFVLIIGLATQGEVPSPPPEPVIHLQAAAVLAVQPAGEPFHRYYPPMSGGAAGLLVGTGFRLTPALAIEGELVTTGTVSAPQRFSYNWIDDYTAMSRDRLFSALVRWKARRQGSLHIVGGAGVARSMVGHGAPRRTLRQTARVTGRSLLPGMGTVRRAVRPHGYRRT